MTSCVVGCDFCGKNRLNASVGYKEYDLCLTCADRLSAEHQGVPALPVPPAPVVPAPMPYPPIHPDIEPLTFMMQDSVSWSDGTPKIQTKMMQNSVRPRTKKVLKRMVQRSVNRSAVPKPPTDFSAFLGRDATEVSNELKTKYPTYSFPTVHQNSMVTMDYRTDRYRITHDDANKVIRIRCG